MFPFTHTCLIPPSNLLDNHRARGKTDVRAEITFPVIIGNKASLSRLTIWKTINGKSEQRMLRVCLSLAAHNRCMIKGGVSETEIVEAGCYLTDECLSRITISVENYCFPPNSTQYPNPVCQNMTTDWCKYAWETWEMIHIFSDLLDTEEI